MKENERKKEKIIEAVIVYPNEPLMAAATAAVEEWFPANGAQAKFLAWLKRQEVSGGVKIHEIEGEFGDTADAHAPDAYIVAVGSTHRSSGEDACAVPCFNSSWYQKIRAFDGAVCKSNGDLFKVKGVFRQGSVDNSRETLIIPLFRLPFRHW